jgi:S1-C subfamily serine protease
MKRRGHGPFCRGRVWLLAGSLAIGGALASAALPLNGQEEPLGRPMDAAPDAQTETIGQSVVKIVATVRFPDYSKPWSKQAPTSVVGSGVVIDGKRVLTCAHLVLYASQIPIQGIGGGDKVTGTVAGISPEMDLAVIKVNEEAFFDSHPALERVAALPEIKDPVAIYGFPTSGSRITRTKGLVSRVEFTKYNYAAAGLRAQVDAAINPGNSGGPAMAEDKMIGLAFAHLNRAENISYFIPCEEIDLFLNNLENGVYHGRPFLNLKLQALQNSALRSFLKLDQSAHGVAVQQVPPLPRDNPLRKWDVITEIGSTPIDDEGMIPLRTNLPVAFSYLLNQVVTNGEAPLTVIRDGQPLHLRVPVSHVEDWVMPPLKGAYPSYFVYGPLVFSGATQDLLIALFSGQAGRYWTSVLLDQGSPLLQRCDDEPAFEGEQLVVVSAFLPYDLSRGYSDPTAEVVKTVNGVPVKNLAHLVEIVRDAKDPFVTIDFAGRDTDTLVFDRAEVASNMDGILSSNSVSAQGSPDVMAVWNLNKN